MPNKENALGAFLKDRRAKLDPAGLGFSMQRRRTPGLRREEVARLANISPTWYAWIEQGRGGTPSVEALDRISRALALTESEREHLFLLAFGSSPAARYESRDEISPLLRRILDRLTVSPAIVRNAVWDILAWNKAALAVLEDYAKLPPRRRNILRLIFASERVRSAQSDWESVARFVVATFRAETVRAGAAGETAALVEELRRSSPEFEKIWNENEVRTNGEACKTLLHPQAGPIRLEFTAFAVDGRPDLTLMIYDPDTREDEEKIEALLRSA